MTAIAAPRRRYPALAGSGRFGRHRRPADRSLPARVIRRMADHRPKRASGLRSRQRDRPSLFTPGDIVRFVPVPSRDAGQRRRVRDAAGESAAFRRTSSRTVTVLRPGLFTTIQDRGRWGHQASGVPVSGAMDLVSHRVANLLVGNDDDAATLEVTLAGPELRIGARGPRGGDRRRSPGRASTGPRRRLASPHAVVPEACCDLASDDRVRGRMSHSMAASMCRRCSAAARRMSAPRWADSMAARWPPAIDCRWDPLPRVMPVASIASRRAPSGGGARLRVLPGPQDDFFSEPAFTLLERTRFVVTPQSNRMGYRLSGAQSFRASPIAR